MGVYGIMYMFITRTQLLSYIFQQLYTWLYIALKTEWLECLYSRHYTVKMAVSQRFKIEVLPNILPAGEEIESDTQDNNLQMIRWLLLERIWVQCYSNLT